MRRLDPALRRAGQMHQDREGISNLGQDVLTFPDVLRETLACGLVVLDAEHQVALFNSEAAAITGLDPAAVLRQPVQSLPAALREMLLNALESKAHLAVREVTLPRGPGAEAHV